MSPHNRRLKRENGFLPREPNSAAAKLLSTRGERSGTEARISSAPGASVVPGAVVPWCRGAVVPEQYRGGTACCRVRINMIPAIAAQALTRTFRGGFTAVDHIELAVQPGQFFGFLGPNGAGKSTTIKMLTGLLAPTKGTVHILGEDLAANPVEVKRNIGVVPEGMALFGRLTASEYLNFVGRMYGLDKVTTAQRSEELLEFMGLANEQKKLITDFSHGMGKKLALAAAVIHNPKVLFLDEPFEGVDAIAAGTLKAMLQGMIARGATIFLTSHVLEIVERLCTHIAIIHRGRIVANGSLDELRDGVQARLAPGAPGEAHERLTLEQIFLATVGSETGITHPEQELSWLK